MGWRAVVVLRPRNVTRGAGDGDIDAAGERRKGDEGRRRIVEAVAVIKAERTKRDRSRGAAC